MEILWNKEQTGHVWWPKAGLLIYPFFGLYPLNNKWTLYIGHPFTERIPIAEVEDVNNPPFEYAEQLWRLRCG